MEIQGEEDGSDTIWGQLLGAAGTSQLPCDLMIQIVSRLPIKSILRFKSVCRTWYSLFNHPNFIQHHSGVSSSFAKMNNLSSFVVVNVENNNNHGDYPKISLLLDHLAAEPILIHPNPPFRVRDSDCLEVLGSVNGLVCLNLDKYVTSIVLWNPATRKHSRIPSPQLSLVSGGSESLIRGFAYDHKTDVYKVVILLLLHSSKVATSARVAIYNTGTNTWKTTEITGFPLDRHFGKSGIEISGVLYWFSKNSSFQELVVSFDVSSEAFRFHSVPPEDKPYPRDWWSWRLEAMGEHPVLTYCEYKDGCHEGIERINIRKLKRRDDGGNDDSFNVEKLSLEPLHDLKAVYRVCGNGKIIAQDLNGKLLFYDREETKYLPRELWLRFFKFYDYTESLVWPSRLA